MRSLTREGGGVGKALFSNLIANYTIACTLLSAMVLARGSDVGDVETQGEDTPRGCHARGR